MPPSAYITAISTATPEHKLRQQVIAEFMSGELALNEERKEKLYKLYEGTGIDHRYSCLPDFKGAGISPVLYNNGHGPNPSTSFRMQVYRKEALKLSLKVVNDLLQKRQLTHRSVTHLITVSCTGMYAPGLDIDLVEQAFLNPGIHRATVNYMGCYAAINALKLADSICRANEGAKVLVVCTELCSLHFQNRNVSWEQIVAASLFGDGAAAVLIEDAPCREKNLQITGFGCRVITGGKKDMAWNITDSGFIMNLSSYIPEMIKGGMQDLIGSIMAESGLRLNQIDHFAIHPGGKKILEACEDALELEKNALQPSYKILREYGNMSSPTVLFVLDEIRKNFTKPQEKILALAFGPGLTIEGMMLDVAE